MEYNQQNTVELTHTAMNALQNAIATALRD
jgi:hypothetical protein